MVGLLGGRLRDYGAAAVRHFTDAELLEKAGRLDDAAHLLGLAAECALKKAAGGYTTPRDREIEGHLPGQLAAQVKGILSARNATGRLLALVADRDLFKGWHINDRYEGDGHVEPDVYKAWKASAICALQAAKLYRKTAP